MRIAALLLFCLFALPAFALTDEAKAVSCNTDADCQLVEFRDCCNHPTSSCISTSFAKVDFMFEHMKLCEKYNRDCLATPPHPTSCVCTPEHICAGKVEAKAEEKK
jgi:hypothetical protein